MLRNDGGKHQWPATAGEADLREKTSVRLRDSVGTLTHNRSFRCTAAIFTLGFICQSVLTSSVVYFMTWNLPGRIEGDELLTGQRREGLYFGVASFLQSLGVALAAQLVGLALDVAGYAEAADAQTESALLGIKLVLAWGPALLIMATIAVTARLPMTRSRHKALLEALERKRRGEPFDEEVVRLVM